MMIALFNSGTESIRLASILNNNHIPFCIIADTKFRPYQDHTLDSIKKRTESLLQYSKELGCTHCIFTPTQELLVLQKQIDTYNQIILPLFQGYLDHCFEHSIIGKIGFVGGYSDICQIESFFGDINKAYQLSYNQKNTKKFQQPLNKRTKDTSMWEYFSRLYSSRNLLVNKTIKEDLKYFKDANIDTLIPLNYRYFNYQRTITSYLNQKKQKFHKRDILQNILQNIMSQENLGTLKTLGTLQLYHTGSPHLINDKKRESLLSQGGEKEIEYKQIIIM